MCQNYPNCNCPSCTQCQDCTQVTPTCVTTITTSCTTEQFTEECPNGLQSTDCLVYTGDTLKDCENNDFIFRGTKFNTFLSQLWETVKCAATATTDTIDYTGANILDCDGNILVPTDTPVTEALNLIWEEVKCPVIPKATDLIIEDLDLTDCDNNLVFSGNTTVFDTINIIWEYVKCLGNTSTSDDIIFTEELKTCQNVTLVSGTGNLTDAINSIWNNIKCWYTDLQDTINDLTDNVNEALDNKQPIWDWSNQSIIVGSGQPAPFNNLETAVGYLSKYHFDGTPVIIELQAGTYTVTTPYWYDPLLKNCSEVVFRRIGNADVTIQANSSVGNGFIGHKEGSAKFEGIKFKQTGAGAVILSEGSSYLELKDCPEIINTTLSGQPLIRLRNGANLVINGLTSLQNLSTTTTAVVWLSDYSNLSGLFKITSSSPVPGIFLTRNSTLTHFINTGVVASGLSIMYIVRDFSKLSVGLGTGNCEYVGITSRFFDINNSEVSFRQYDSGTTTITGLAGSTNSTELIFASNNSKLEISSNIISTNFKKAFWIRNNSNLIMKSINASQMTQVNVISDNSCVNFLPGTAGSSVTLSYISSPGWVISLQLSSKLFSPFILIIGVTSNYFLLYDNSYANTQGQQLNDPTLTTKTSTSFVN